MECNGVLCMLHYACPSWNTTVRNRSVRLYHQRFALYLCKSLLYRSCRFFHTSCFSTSVPTTAGIWSTTRPYILVWRLMTFHINVLSNISFLPTRICLWSYQKHLQRRDIFLQILYLMYLQKSLCILRSHQDARRIHLFIMEVSPCLCSSIWIVTSWVRHRVSFLI